MPQDPMRVSYSFGTGMTALGKKLLIIYSVIYILELLLEHWLHIPAVYFLQLWPFSSEGFQVWQIFTSPFIHNPLNPIGFLINCLIFYFFAGSVERSLGSSRFLILFYLSALGAAVSGLAFSNVSGFNTPFSGMMPSLLALVVIFGFLNPEAAILLFFIIPLKAKYISYGTILITILTFLAKVNPHGAYDIGGILFGYIYFRGPRNVFDPDLIYLKYSQWQFERKKRSFRVIDGGNKGKKDNDKPTYH